MRGNYPAQDGDKKLGKPVHHVHVAGGEDGPEAALPVTFGLLLNLVGVMGADASKAQIWRYLGQYVAGANAEAYPELDRLIDNAMAYNRDFVAPTLQRRKPQGGEGAALKELDDKLAALPADASPDDIRSEEHTSEPQSLMRISYAVFCLKKKLYRHENYHIRKTETS